MRNRDEASDQDLNFQLQLFTWKIDVVQYQLSNTKMNNYKADTMLLWDGGTIL